MGPLIGTICQSATHVGLKIQIGISSFTNRQIKPDRRILQATLKGGPCVAVVVDPVHEEGWARCQTGIIGERGHVRLGIGCGCG